MTDLVVIAPVVPMAVHDEFRAGTLPLHLTVLPKVRVPAERFDLIVSELCELGRTTRGPIVVVGAAREVFGRDVAVPVTTMDTPPGLIELHRGLLARARQAGALPVVAGFVGDGYRPHVSRAGGHEVRPGEAIALGTLAVIDCSASLRTVVATTALA